MADDPLKDQPRHDPAYAPDPPTNAVPVTRAEYDALEGRVSATEYQIRQMKVWNGVIA